LINKYSGLLEFYKRKEGEFNNKIDELITILTKFKYTKEGING